MPTNRAVLQRRLKLGALQVESPDVARLVVGRQLKDAAIGIGPDRAIDRICRQAAQGAVAFDVDRLLKDDRFRQLVNALRCSPRWLPPRRRGKVILTRTRSPSTMIK